MNRLAPLATLLALLPSLAALRLLPSLTALLISAALALLVTDTLALVILTAAEKLEIVSIDFGSIFLDTLLVGIAPCTQATLNIKLGSLFHESLNHIGCLPPGNYVVPFGVFAQLSVAIPVTFCRSECKRGDLSAAALAVSFEVTYFWVSSDVTDKHYFVK